MAPVLRKVTQTIPQPDITSVAVVTLGNIQRWPARHLGTFTETSSFTAVVQKRDGTPNVVENYSAGKGSGLSRTDKGVIAGCVISASLLLLLLCWCYLRRSRFPSWKSRFSATKVPPESQDSPSESPPPDPAPADNPPKTKKSVTIATDLPRYLRSKDTKSSISPLVRLSTEMNLRTGLATREGSSGQPVRFMIRQSERPRMRRHRKSHKRRRKGKAVGTDGTT